MTRRIEDLDSLELEQYIELIKTFKCLDDLRKANRKVIKEFKRLCVNVFHVDIDKKTLTKLKDKNNLLEKIYQIYR